LAQAITQVVLQSSFSFRMKVGAFVLALVTNADTEKTFDQFLLDHGKSYGQEERVIRFKIFEENLAKAKQAQSTSDSATFGITQFSDISEVEFLVRMGLKYPEEWNRKPVDNIFSNDELAVAPASVDWRELGAVTQVKDQGHCGSCWAFSTIGNIEGQHFRATGELVTLSEQELTSCDNKDGGCQGGLMTQAFDFIVQDRYGEVVKSDWYPYTSNDGISPGCGGIDGKHTLCKGSGAGTDAWCTQFCYNAQGKALCTPDLCDCSPTGEHVGAKISGHESLPQDEDQLAAYVAQHGPVSIAVGVPLGSVWQSYTGGILTRAQCGASPPNHGVLLVGFNKDEGYWILKNSWGTKFGEAGFIRLEYGQNTCNLVHDASSSTGASMAAVV